MTAAPAIRCSPSDADAVRAQVARVLKSSAFQQSQRRQRFLQFLADETIAGRSERLKGYTIAVEVFERPVSFDPLVDPVVRIEAGRLRDKLREYYETEGKNDAIRIELPKGGYQLQIEKRCEDTKPAPQDAGQIDGAGKLERPYAMRTRAYAAAVTVAIAALLVAFLMPNGWRPVSPRTEGPSIAVLPFSNLGSDERWDRFAAGVTEDIITDLSQSRDMRVIARNSTEVYKNKPVDVRQVGRELDVKYVMEGSIQEAAGRIRVTAQLVETASGGHIWSERYDRHADDLFAVQNEITQRIASTLMGYQGQVAEAERKIIRRKPPASLSAYETYLLGMEAKHKVTKESLAEAERLLRRAIELDPQFARAYCGLATVQYYLIDLGLTPSVDAAVQQMWEAADQAVKLAPNDGLTHQVLGMAYGYQGKSAQSLAELNRAVELAPADADLLVAVAWSLPAFGESARAVRMIEHALRLNPRYPDWYNQGLSHIYFFAEHYDEAVSYRLLVKQPAAFDYAFIAMANAHRNQLDDAASATSKTLALDPGWNAERYVVISGGYADREAELLVAGARKAGLPDCLTAEQFKDYEAFAGVPSCNAERARPSASVGPSAGRSISTPALASP